MTSFHRIYVDGKGQLVAGEAVFGETPNPQTLLGDKMSYEDFGLELVEDDLGVMDYAQLGEDVYTSLGDEDDDDDYDEYDEFGARSMRAVRPRKGYRRYRPRGRRHLKRPPSAMRGRPQVVQKTILTAQTAVNPAAGAQTVTVRPQFDFVSEDMTFTGSVGNWTITSIQFGDRIVFSNATGVPVAIFATVSFVRGLVKGAAIAAGLDIQVAANIAASTTTTQLIATLTGLKRGTSGCGPGAV